MGKFYEYRHTYRIFMGTSNGILRGHNEMNFAKLISTLSTVLLDIDIKRDPLYNKKQLLKGQEITKNSFNILFTSSKMSFDDVTKRPIFYVCLKMYEKRHFECCRLYNSTKSNLKCGFMEWLVVTVSWTYGRQMKENYSKLL